MARFGNLGTQYFDNSGDPLVSGKIFFFESGTTTAKDTFSDVNLSIPNTNPVILSGAGRQPNIFFNGSARAVLTDGNSVQLEVRDPVGITTAGNFELWNALIVYSISEIVISTDNRYFRSISNGNSNNDPITSPSFWEEIEFLSVWNSSFSYVLGATVKASDGLLYVSLSNSNLNNNPISSPLQWGPPVAVPNADLGGAESTTSSGDIILTSLSKRLQIVSITAAGKKITLPDATTVATGSPLFVIKNIGNFPFDVHNSNGVYLFTLPDRSSVILSCSDNTIVSGVWNADGDGLKVISPESPIVLNALASTNVSVEKLSDTSFILVYEETVLNRARGQVINIGSPDGVVTTLTAENTANTTISVLSATQILVSFRGSTNTPKVLIVDYAGNALTTNAAVEASAVTTGQKTYVNRLTDTSAILSYDSGGSLAITSHVITVAASTPTVNTGVVTITATISAPVRASTITATKCFVMAQSTSGLTCRLFTISGTTITNVGGKFILSSVTPGPIGQVDSEYMGGDIVLVSSVGPNDSGNLVLFSMDISGDTPLILDRWTGPSSAGSSISALKIIDANTAIVLWASVNKGGHFISKVHVSSDGSITVVTLTRVRITSSAANDGQDIVVLTPTLGSECRRNIDKFIEQINFSIGDV